MTFQFFQREIVTRVHRILAGERVALAQTFLIFTFLAGVFGREDGCLTFFFTLVPTLDETGSSILLDRLCRLCGIFFWKFFSLTIPSSLLFNLFYRYHLRFAKLWRYHSTNTLVFLVMGWRMDSGWGWGWGQMHARKC